MTKKKLLIKHNDKYQSSVEHLGGSVDFSHLDFITPPSKVSESLYGHADMSLQCKSVDSTRVQRLYSGQFLLMLLHQISEPGRERRHLIYLLKKKPKQPTNKKTYNCNNNNKSPKEV